MKKDMFAVIWSAFIVLIIIFMVFSHVIFGIYPFGPINTLEVTISRAYIDVSGSGDSKKSHYMVGTDKGVFEVDNSLWLWLWNADEIYAQIKQGESYKLTTKGNKLVNFIWQEYPYIIKVENLNLEKK